MLIISKAEATAIQFQKYFSKGGEFPELNGRRYYYRQTESGMYEIMLEGLHFLVDGDYSHLPTLTKETAHIGAAYAWCDGFQILDELYSISEEYATENWLCYLDRAKTTANVYGVIHHHDFSIIGSRLSQWAKTPYAPEQEEPEEIPF